MMQNAMNNNPSGSTKARRPAHVLAVALLCATWMLICVGGVVTTQRAGMAFEDWPTSDGSNMFLYPWFRAAGDKFIEHGHRLFGALVGMIAIALCASLWITEGGRRRWLAWLGVAALALVIFQGVLGGMRVRASDIDLAKIHGCVAPLFFALTVAIAVFTSRWWCDRKIVRCMASGRLQRIAIVTTVLAYLQLILGAQLRHVAPFSSGGAFRMAVLFHLVLAAVLLLDVLVLVVLMRRHLSDERTLVRPSQLLLGMIVVQVVLGMGSWVLKYSWPAGIFADSRLVAGWTNTAGGVAESIVVTAHVAVGSLILGTSLLISLRLLRGMRKAANPQLGAIALLGVTL